MNIDENVVESVSGEYRRKVWLMKVGNSPQKLCVFLDGEFYLERVGAPAILELLQKAGAIPSVVAVFVSNLDNAARHADFICNTNYARFVAKDVVAWARAKEPGIGELGHVVVGLSLSGLAGAFLTLSHPEVFPACIVQSGSFWWNEEWFAENAASFPAAARRCWLSVGDKETEKGVSHEPSGMQQEETQLASVRKAAEALQAMGAVVRSASSPAAMRSSPGRKNYLQRFDG